LTVPLRPLQESGHLTPPPFVALREGCDQFMLTIEPRYDGPNTSTAFVSIKVMERDESENVNHR
jgi:hypothetical protein